MADAELIRIYHIPSGEIIAEGPRGLGITPFEGNYYIQRRYMKTAGFKVTLYLRGESVLASSASVILNGLQKPRLSLSSMGRDN